MVPSDELEEEKVDGKDMDDVVEEEEEVDGKDMEVVVADDEDVDGKDIEDGMAVAAAGAVMVVVVVGAGAIGEKNLWMIVKRLGDVIGAGAAGAIPVFGGTEGAIAEGGEHKFC
jgi:hypothetical protein